LHIPLDGSSRGTRSAVSSSRFCSSTACCSAGRASFERHDDLRRGVVTLEQWLRGVLAAPPRAPTA
jgi:hypothetical protein